MKALEGFPENAKLLARRSGLAILGHSAPAIAGRWATEMFLATRRMRASSAPGAPLGATATQIGGDAGRAVYFWGKRGPLVLLVHGWGADSGAMCSLVRPLRDRGCRVVAFDAPAHGANEGNKTTMTEFVAAVGDVIEQFAPDAELHAVVGHSLGGLAAVAALQGARRSPKRLVLMSVPSSLNRALHSFVGFWRLTPKVEARIRHELSHSHGVPIEHWDVRTLATRDRFPALVLHDRIDVFVPVEEAQVVAQALGDQVRVEITEGLGHTRILADRYTTSLVADFVSSAAGDTVSPS